jgi:hypothetical protein
MFEKDYWVACLLMPDYVQISDALATLQLTVIPAGIAGIQGTGT